MSVLISLFVYVKEKWKSLKDKKTSPTPVKPRSTGIIVHIHGGGFVAQSSASHEVPFLHIYVSYMYV